MLERLQKILSARGIASRRKAEEIINAGLVSVNGVVALLGQKADPEVDRIEVDGRVLEARRTLLYYVMHKPVGVVTENVEGQGLEGCKRHKGSKGGGAEKVTVRDLLPADLRGKLFPVGRLDKDSSGLLLLTNDGVLAYRLTHPKFDHEKEYEVTVDCPITEGQLRKLREGLKILGEQTKPANVTRRGPLVFRIALTEGRNRQLRRMCQKVGCSVQTLRRVRIVTLEDPQLKPGQLRAMTREETQTLLSATGAAGGLSS